MTTDAADAEGIQITWGNVPPTNFFMCPDAVFYDDRISPSAIKLYMLLGRYATRSDNAAVWPSFKTMMAHLRVSSEQTIRNSLDQLEAAGHIKRERVSGKTSLITIYWPSDGPTWGWHGPKELGDARNPDPPKTLGGTPSENWGGTPPENWGGYKSVSTSKNITKGTSPTATSRDPESSATELMSTTTEHATVAPTAVEAAPPDVNTPHGMFRAFCEATEQDMTLADKRTRSIGYKLAKEMVNDGIKTWEVTACVRYLRSQRWRTAPVTMPLVAKEIGPWRMAGRPASERPRRTDGPRSFTELADEVMQEKRTTMNGHATGNVFDDDVIDAEFRPHA